MSSIYRGLRVMDPLDLPNVPADVRLLVDSGPIPRFASTAEMVAGTSPASAGMLAAVNGVVYRFNGVAWTQVVPSWRASSYGGNETASAAAITELNRMTLPVAGTYWIQTLIAWDSGANGQEFHGYLTVGAAGVYFQQRMTVNTSSAPKVGQAILGGIVTINEPQDITTWTNLYFGAGGSSTTFRGDLYAWGMELNGLPA